MRDGEVETRHGASGRWGDGEDGEDGGINSKLDQGGFSYIWVK